MSTIVALLSSDLSFWEKLSMWYEQSVLSELLRYFSDRFFTVEFGVYENFSISSSAGVAARNMILALAIGFIVAALMTAYTRVVLGDFVRTLIKENCKTPDTAKTLYELGYFRSVSIRSALARGAILRMAVHSCSLDERSAAKNTPAVTASDETDTAEPTDMQTDGSEQTATPDVSKPIASMKEGRIDFLKTAFYIPEELRIRAEIRFEKKGSGWLPVIAVVALIIVVATVLCWLLPDIVQFADNLISVFSPK